MQEDNTRTAHFSETIFYANQNINKNQKDRSYYNSFLFHVLLLFTFLISRITRKIQVTVIY